MYSSRQEAATFAVLCARDADIVTTISSAEFAMELVDYAGVTNTKSIREIKARTNIGSRIFVRTFAERCMTFPWR
jgi:hypothetical protein